jgi:hypothetical protein
MHGSSLGRQYQQVLQGFALLLKLAQNYNILARRKNILNRIQDVIPTPAINKKIANPAPNE